MVKNHCVAGHCETCICPTCGDLQDGSKKDCMLEAYESASSWGDTYDKVLCVLLGLVIMFCIDKVFF